MSNGVKALGEAIRARRQGRLLTQDDLADRAGIKITTLRNIEMGRTEYPSTQTIRKIARAFDCEPAELMPRLSAGLNRDMLALTSPLRDRPLPNDWAAFVAAQLTRTDLMMDRRSALKMTILAGASLLDPVESWLWAFECNTGRKGRFAPERHHDIEHLEEAARTFRALREGPGGGTYRKPVVALLDEAASIFEDDGLPTAAKERLYRVMADLAGVAAAMSSDCGLNRQAQEYYALALRCAYAGGDFVFGTHVLVSMANQMLCLGRPYDALDLIRLAKQRVDRSTDPRVLAYLDTREAWAFAALVRVPAFRRATMQAHEHLADAPAAGGPYWIAHFDAAELSGITGGRLMELARHSPKEFGENAVAELSRAVQSAPVKTGRIFALDQIDLAECYFLLGDTTAAIEQTNQALNALEYTRSKRPIDRLGELLQQTEKAHRMPAIVDLQGRIRQTLTSRQAMWA